MVTSSSRRQRLGHFVDLARVYRGWSRVQLSEALGRDPTKLVPESGNPKLDLLVGLADVLDWPLGDVAESVWEVTDRARAGDDHGASAESADGRSSGTVSNEGSADAFRSLDRHALTLHRDGRFREMLSVGGRMLDVASAPTERAIACNRIAGAFDGLGRYARALGALQSGLAERGVPDTLRVMLQVNLANAHYTLWHLLEARSIGRELIDHFQECAPQTRVERVSHAFAHYVRGHAARRLLDDRPEVAERLASDARRDLEQARAMYETLHAELGDASYLGVASTCAAGVLEVDVVLGAIEPAEALSRLERDLEPTAVEPAEWPSGDRLETIGWSSVFACNIALRHLEGEQLQRRMAIFTNKALEIAEALDHWSMRERAFTLEHFRRARAGLESAQSSAWRLDDEEVRVLAGTMGRFPAFREIGWRILESANVFDVA